MTRKGSTVWYRLRASKLGACRKCMVLSTGLLTASVGALGASVAWLPIAVFLAIMATGIFTVLTGAHAVMSVLRQLATWQLQSPGKEDVPNRCGR